MTKEEMETAINEIWAMFRETDRRFKETAQRIQETDKHLKETDKNLKETDRNLKETDRNLKETDEHLKETDKHLKETDKYIKETDRHLKQTDRQIRELGKQIGGLGRKFGGFTEGMAFPSMRRILMERFKVEFISPRVLVRRNSDTLELDLLAYSNGGINEAYIVEVKSRLKDDDIQDMLRDLNRFLRFFPEHKDKALYGIIAAVDVTDQLRKKVLDAGLYLATIRDDTFCLEVPEGFKAKRFN